MFVLLGKFVTRHWLAVIVGWVLVVVLLYAVAPNWDDVTRDGDLAFLPPQMPSVRGEQLLSDAFPRDRAKSEIAVYVGREEGALQGDELAVAYDLARQFKNLHGVAALTRAKQHVRGRTTAAGGRSELRRWLPACRRGCWARPRPPSTKRFGWTNCWPATGPRRMPPQRRKPCLLTRFAATSGWRRRTTTVRWSTCGWETGRSGRRCWTPELDRAFQNRGLLPFPEQAERLPLLDVWTWQDEVFGEKLRKPEVRAMLLALVQRVHGGGQHRGAGLSGDDSGRGAATLLGESRERVQIGFSGSAAVGGDLLRAAEDSIENTELFTVVLVVLILSFVYRSPLLVVMPVVTISASFVAATSIVALLTQVDLLPGFEWWDFKVFTTTKVFIVVILYGSGTDFFLFLVARYREDLEHGCEYREAIAKSLGAVGTALAASALTTILGLATMFFADFGKFKNSGPAIGLCLVVTLLACVTLAPALLRAFGKACFGRLGSLACRLA